ncbi:hypothetical protein [Sphingobium tyrosinilyticum]|uniref:Uncharacterized protein n=1 Tax=Sphingobium tyrosinilyticum TaxID=2715436 RepID=A0ABV9F0N3_9SPHN
MAMTDFEDEGLRASLEAAIGAENVRCGRDIGERYRLDLTRRYAGTPAFLVKPGTTE